MSLLKMIGNALGLQAAPAEREASPRASTARRATPSEVSSASKRPARRTAPRVDRAGAQRAERRRSPRQQMGNEITVWVRQRFLEAQLVDLSSGGALVETENERKIGLTIGIALQVGDVSMTLPARVYRSTLEGTHYRLGCRFDGLDRRERAFLRLYQRVHRDQQAEAQAPAAAPSDAGTRPAPPAEQPEEQSNVLCSLLVRVGS